MEHVSIFFIPNFKAGGRPFNICSKDKSSTNEDLCFLSLSLIETSFASLRVDTFFFHHQKFFLHELQPAEPRCRTHCEISFYIQTTHWIFTLTLTFSSSVHSDQCSASASVWTTQIIRHVFNKQRPQQASPSWHVCPFTGPAWRSASRWRTAGLIWTDGRWASHDELRYAQEIFFLLLHGSASLQGSQMDKCVKFKNILSEVKIKSCEFVFSWLDLPLTL